MTVRQMILAELHSSTMPRCEFRAAKSKIQ